MSFDTPGDTGAQVGGASFGIGIDLQQFERDLDRAESVARARVARIQTLFDNIRINERTSGTGGVAARRGQPTVPDDRAQTYRQRQEVVITRTTRVVNSPSPPPPTTPRAIRQIQEQTIHRVIRVVGALVPQPGLPSSVQQRQNIIIRRQALVTQTGTLPVPPNPPRIVQSQEIAVIRRARLNNVRQTFPPPLPQPDLRQNQQITVARVTRTIQRPVAAPAPQPPLTQTQDVRVQRTPHVTTVGAVPPPPHDLPPARQQQEVTIFRIARLALQAPPRLPALAAPLIQQTQRIEISRVSTVVAQPGVPPPPPLPVLGQTQTVSVRRTARLTAVQLALPAPQSPPALAQNQELTVRRLARIVGPPALSAPGAPGPVQQTQAITIRRVSTATNQPVPAPPLPQPIHQEQDISVERQTKLIDRQQTPLPPAQIQATIRQTQRIDVARVARVSAANRLPQPGLPQPVRQTQDISVTRVTRVSGRQVAPPIAPPRVIQVQEIDVTRTAHVGRTPALPAPQPFPALQSRQNIRVSRTASVTGQLALPPPTPAPTIQQQQDITLRRVAHLVPPGALPAPIPPAQLRQIQIITVARVRQAVEQSIPPPPAPEGVRQTQQITVIRRARAVDAHVPAILPQVPVQQQQLITVTRRIALGARAPQLALPAPPRPISQTQPVTVQRRVRVYDQPLPRLALPGRVQQQQNVDITRVARVVGARPATAPPALPPVRQQQRIEISRVARALPAPPVRAPLPPPSVQQAQVIRVTRATRVVQSLLALPAPATPRPIQQRQQITITRERRAIDHHPSLPALPAPIRQVQQMSIERVPRVTTSASPLSAPAPLAPTRQIQEVVVSRVTRRGAEQQLALPSARNLPPVIRQTQALAVVRVARLAGATPVLPPPAQPQPISLTQRLAVTRVPVVTPGRRAPAVAPTLPTVRQAQPVVVTQTEEVVVNRRRRGLVQPAESDPRISQLPVGQFFHQTTPVSAELIRQQGFVIPKLEGVDPQKFKTNRLLDLAVPRAVFLKQTRDVIRGGQLGESNVQVPVVPTRTLNVLDVDSDFRDTRSHLSESSRTRVQAAQKQLDRVYNTPGKYSTELFYKQLARITDRSQKIVTDDLISRGIEAIRFRDRDQADALAVLDPKLLQVGELQQPARRRRTPQARPPTRRRGQATRSVEPNENLLPVVAEPSRLSVIEVPQAARTTVQQRRAQLTLPSPRAQLALPAPQPAEFVPVVRPTTRRQRATRPQTEVGAVDQTASVSTARVAFGAFNNTLDQTAGSEDRLAEVMRSKTAALNAQLQVAERATAVFEAFTRALLEAAAAEGNLQQASQRAAATPTHTDFTRAAPQQPTPQISDRPPTRSATAHTTAPLLPGVTNLPIADSGAEISGPAQVANTLLKHVLSEDAQRTLQSYRRAVSQIQAQLGTAPTLTPADFGILTGRPQQQRPTATSNAGDGEIDPAVRERSLTRIRTQARRRDASEGDARQRARARVRTRLQRGDATDADRAIRNAAGLQRIIDRQPDVEPVGEVRRDAQIDTLTSRQTSLRGRLERSFQVARSRIRARAIRDTDRDQRASGVEAATTPGPFGPEQVFTDTGPRQRARLAQDTADQREATRRRNQVSALLVQQRRQEERLASQAVRQGRTQGPEEPRITPPEQRHRQSTGVFGTGVNRADAIRIAAGFVGIPIGLNLFASIARDVHAVVDAVVQDTRRLSQSFRDVGVAYGQLGQQRLARGALEFTASPQTRGTEQEALAAAASLGPLANQYSLTTDQVTALTVAEGQLARIHGTGLPQAGQILEQVLRGNTEAGHELGLQLTDEYGRLRSVGIGFDDLVQVVGRARAEQILYRDIQADVSRQQRNSVLTSNELNEATDQLNKTIDNVRSAAARAATGPVTTVTRAANAALQPVSNPAGVNAAAATFALGGGLTTGAPALVARAVENQVRQPIRDLRASINDAVSNVFNAATQSPAGQATSRVASPLVEVNKQIATTGGNALQQGAQAAAEQLGKFGIGVGNATESAEQLAAEQKKASAIIDAQNEQQIRLSEAIVNQISAKELAAARDINLIGTAQQPESIVGQQVAAARSATIAAAAQGPNFPLAQLSPEQISTIAQRRADDAQRQRDIVSTATQAEPQFAEDDPRVVSQRNLVNAQHDQAVAQKRQAAAQGQVNILGVESDQRRLSVQSDLNEIAQTQIQLQNELAPKLIEEVSIRNQIALASQQNLDLVERKARAEKAALPAQAALSQVNFVEQRAVQRAVVASVERAQGKAPSFDINEQIQTIIDAEFQRPQLELDVTDKQRPVELANQALQQDEIDRQLRTIPFQKREQQLQREILPPQEALAVAQSQADSIQRALASADLASGPARIEAEIALSNAHLEEILAAIRINTAEADVAQLPPITVQNTITGNGSVTVDQDTLDRITAASSAGAIDALNRAREMAAKRVSKDVAGGR